MGGGVLDFARIKLTQPSLAGAGAELGNSENSELSKGDLIGNLIRGGGNQIRLDTFKFSSISN